MYQDEMIIETGISCFHTWLITLYLVHITRGKVSSGCIVANDQAAVPTQFLHKYKYKYRYKYKYKYRYKFKYKYRYTYSYKYRYKYTYK